MCGIAGVLFPAPSMSRDDLRGLAARMADRVEHRGPDGSGTWVDEGAGIAFGHRRLKVIDLSEAGHQPMVSERGRYVISYNGEVYNFAALRTELERAGCRFRGHSDTEVILEGVERWGITTTVNRLVGMFAMSLWDRESRTLTLVRDRLGIKPLYYGLLEGRFLFASELKAFHACSRWRPVLDHDALATFVRLNYVPAPQSIFQDTWKLEAGCMLSIRAGEAPRIERFWDLLEVVGTGQGAPRVGTGVDDATDELEHVLSEAVEGCMVADVPVGVFLSGGIDSSSVTALMQRHGDKPVRTFTIGFGVPDLDESAHARRVAAHLRSEHTELYVSPETALELVPRVAEIYDEPFADSSQIPTYLVSEMTRGHVTVALSGDGGDEVFAGYNRYAQGRTLQPVLTHMPSWMRRVAANSLQSVPPGIWTGLCRAVPGRWRPSMVGDKLHKLAEVLRGSTDTFYRDLVSHWRRADDMILGGHEPPGLLSRENDLAKRIPDFVARMQVLDTLTYLPDDILTKVDRASMAVSLEVRVPLLDHRVVEFAWKLPMNMKLRSGTGKWLLRRLLNRHVPGALVDRPKAGFAVPLDRWLRGSLRDWAEDLLQDECLRADGILDADAVHDAWRSHLSGSRNHQHELWGVLMFQAWKRRWLA